MRRQWEERTRAGDDNDERSGGERADGDEERSMRACDDNERRGGRAGNGEEERREQLHAKPWEGKTLTRCTHRGLLFCSLSKTYISRLSTQRQTPAPMPHGVALSEDLRGVLIHIHVSSSLDSKALARLTGIPVRTIQRILSNWKKTGEVKTAPTGKKGRPRALDFSDTQVRLRFLLVFKKLTPILPVSAVNGFAIQ